MQRFNIANPAFEYDAEDPEGFRSARVKVGPILDIAHPPRSQLRGMEDMADMPVRAPARMAVPVEVGTITITAEVDITWAVE